MLRPASLERRLGLSLALGVAVIWAIVAAAAVWSVQHELEETFDSGLQETGQRLLPLAMEAVFEDDDEIPIVKSIVPHEEYLTYLLRTADGQVLLSSHDADPGAFPGRPSQGFQNYGSLRIYGERSPRDSIYLEVAEPLEHRREAAWEAAFTLFGSLIVLLPLSFLAVWWIVRRSLAPLVTLKREIEARGAGDLSAVQSEGLPSELEPIADAVCSLLDRLKRTLEVERSFAANAAHELRTPLAAALAQTQRLIAETRSDDSAARARQIEVALQNLIHLSEKLLQLAKAEGGGLLAETPADLSTVLRHLVGELDRSSEKAAGGQGATGKIVIESEGPLHSRVDPDSFAILMRNLIENALKYGAKDEPVELSYGKGWISVVNGGAPLSSEALTRIRRPFERARQGKDGFGLGLGIADAIAAGAGGRLEVFSPARGRSDGFEAHVSLPQ